MQVYGYIGNRGTHKTPRLMRMIKLAFILSFKWRFQKRIVGNRARKRSLAVLTAVLLALGPSCLELGLEWGY